MAFGDIVLLKNKKPLGPFTRTQIQEGLSRGDFSPRDLAHTPGLKDWLPLLEVLHHLDRETVHVPRSREERTLPPLPGETPSSMPKKTSIGEVERKAAPISSLPVESKEEMPVPAVDKTAKPPVLSIRDSGSATKGPPPSLPLFRFEPGPVRARVLAWIIDWLVLFVPVLVVFGFGYAIWAVQGPLEHRDPETARQERALLLRHLRELVTAVAIGFAWLYAAGLESSRWQGTIGKQIAGLVVVDAAGHRLSFLHATGRHAAKYLSALPVFLGFMAALFNSQRLAWHDRLSGTRVVKR